MPSESLYDCLVIFNLCPAGQTTGDPKIVNVITIVHTNNPAPNKAPTLYATPSADPDATIAVTTSPAPFAKANKVTPANASENPNHC